MAAIFKKLNLKDQREILVLDPPASFQPKLDSLTGVTVRRSLDGLTSLTFALTFVTRLDDLSAAARLLAARASSDAILWFAYPKASSKKYRCDFNRDTGWQVLGELGFEPVRQVAIDEDWSALRFRRVEYIRSMNRESQRALSPQGKQRTSNK